jgi:hypothetical protein
VTPWGRGVPCRRFEMRSLAALLRAGNGMLPGTFEDVDRNLLE